MRARGAPRARRVGPLLFWVFDGLFVSQRVTGTLGRTASRAFLYGEGAFLLPPHRPFSHARFGFFFWGHWPGALRTASCNVTREIGGTNSERCYENPPEPSAVPAEPRDFYNCMGSVFLYDLVGNAARFFEEPFSETFPPILAFFQSR